MPDDYSADRFTAGTVAVGGSATGDIETAHDQDWFAVELVAGRTYQFDLGGSPSEGGTLRDTYLRAIYDSEGRYQSDSYSDDFGGSRDSRVTFTASQSGRYYVRASGDRDETGSYTLRVSDVTPGSGRGPATGRPACGNGRTGRAGAGARGGRGSRGHHGVGGAAVPAGHARRRRRWGGLVPVHAERGARGGAWASGQDADADLVLEDAAGNVLHSGERSSTTNEWVRETLLAGTYYVRVEAQEAGANTYVFRYGVGDADPAEVARLEAVFVRGPPETELETSPGQSTPGAGGRTTVSEGELDETDFPANTTTTGRVDVGDPAVGTIDPGDDTDWFGMELVAGKRYQLDLEGAETQRGFVEDPWLRGIFDADGNEIPNTNDDNSGVGKNARVIYTPAADGTHFVWAASVGSGTGNYRLSVIELGANGASEADTDFPATTSTSGEVEVGGSATGKIKTAGDQDWFAVELEAGRTYQIDLEGISTGRGSLADPLLFPGIYDASGSLIPNTEDDDGGEDINSRVIFTPTADGTYYISASGYIDRDNLNTGTYTLSVRDLTPPGVFVEGATDLADDATTAGEIVVGGFAAIGTISEPGRSRGYDTFDRDWFAVELEAWQTYQIDLEGGFLGSDGTYINSGLLPEIIAIYDADSNFLHYTSDREASGPGDAARVEFTPNATGAYYISASGVPHTTGDYELTVSNITPDFDSQAADRSTNGRVTVGGSATGKIDTYQDVDWFKVTLTAGTEYQIDLEGRATGSGSLYDPRLRAIFDANGNEIPGTVNDDGGEGYNSRLLFTPDATGTHYVAAGAMADYQGTYMLSVEVADAM